MNITIEKATDILLEQVELAKGYSEDQTVTIKYVWDNWVHEVITSQFSIEDVYKELDKRGISY